MTKAYRRRDRTWRECISLEDFQRVARETVGRERPNKETDDWCKNLFGKVASPGVKDPLRRKQREEAVLAGLERVERKHRDGDHKSNTKKRKRTTDSGHLSEDRRPRHRESTYLENVGRVVEGSPSRAVLVQRHGPISPVSPVTPTRPRVSRRLAPLMSMTNVAVTDPTTSPKSPLDGRGCNLLGFDQVTEEEGSKGSKARSSGNADPFVDDKRDGHVGRNTTHPFIIPSLVPPLSASTTTSRQKRMDTPGDPDVHAVPSDSPTNVSSKGELGTKQSTPLGPQANPERHSQSVAGRSLPTPVSNGPIKRVPPPAGSPIGTEAEGASIGVKRTREDEEDVRSSSKKVVLARPSLSAQRVPGSSRDLKPSETTFMENPHSIRKISKSKTRKGNMSVDAIKARLIRATSTLQVIPSQSPDAAIRSPAVAVVTRAIKSRGVEERSVHEKSLEDEVEPIRQKAGPSALTFGIPAPFPPGTSGPGSLLGCPNNSDKIAAYHGADKFYSGRPPSTTPPQLREVSELVNEDGKTSAPSPGEDTKQDDAQARQPGQQKPEGSKKATGRFPSLILEPQQLLFTDTPVGILMITSVVWFARDVHDPEPPYRPSSPQLVPRMNEVSQLESLLVACGWHRKKGFSSKRGIERGVVFVDYEEQGDVQPVIKTHWVVQQCEHAHRLATQHQTPTERGMRPIWIMDARALRWERLRSMKSGDSLDALEEFVLWKKV